MKTHSPVLPAISKEARQILNFLSKKKKSMPSLLILTHDYPDPDAIASAYALHYLAERRYGIQAKIVYGGIIGRMENRAMVNLLRIPVRKVKASDFRKYPQVALIDTQPNFKNNSLPERCRATLVIDQHPSDSKPDADLAIVDPECGATSVILSQAMLMSRLPIPEPIATALAYGILSDTLNLYRAQGDEAVQTYLAILHHSDLKTLARIQNPVRSRKFFSTLGKSIENAMFRRGLIVAKLGVVESPDLVAQIADFLLSYRGVSWSLCLGRYRGKLHLSLRAARSTLDAGEVLREAVPSRGQAGGHDVIGGGSIRIGSKAGEKVWFEAEETVILRLRRRLRIPVRRGFYRPFRHGVRSR